MKRQEFFLKIFPLLLLIVLSFIFCFWKLNKPPLETWDEYIYFNVVYDTIESKDHLILKKNNWFTFSTTGDCWFNPTSWFNRLRLNQSCQFQKQPSNYFFEKPPLWFYLTFLVTKVFGISNFSVRLVSAVSGFLLILAITYVGWKMFSYKAGLIAGYSTLATRQLFLVNQNIFSSHTLRSADLESLFLLLLVLSFFAFWNSFRSNNKKTIWLITASLLTGLGVLTKGPFALLPAIVFFLYKVINYKNFPLKTTLKQFFILPAKGWSAFGGIFSFLIILVPWHLYMHLRFGNEFWNSYLWYHLLNRGLTTLEGHIEPFYFYITLLFRKDFFFSGEILLAAVVFLVAKFKSQIIKNFSLFYIFAIPLMVILLITIAQTKLSWYIFPAYLFFFLIAGKFFHELGKIGNKSLRIFSLGFFVLILSIQIYMNLYSILKL